MPKISQYPTTTTLQDGDLFDVSVDNLDGTYTSKSIRKDDLETEIGGALTNVYNTDGALDSDRDFDLDGYSLTFLGVTNGIGIGASPNSDVCLDLSSQNELGMALPNGQTASRPASPTTGFIWFNTTTNQFEGYNGSAWVLIG